MGGGEGEVFVPVDAFIDDEVLGEDFAVDALAGGAGAGDGVGGVGGGDVDDVDGHVEQAGYCDDSLGGFAFDGRRAGQGVAFGAGDAFGQKLLLQVRDGFAVFGVDVADGAEFFGAGEAAEHDGVVDHEGAFVGHEMFEAGDAVVADKDAHFFRDFV